MNETQESREHAILALTGGGRKRLDENDLDALSVLADDDGMTLACLLLRGSEINGRKL